jgi:hypothetical protein
MASSCVPAILYALAISLCDLFKSRRRLQAENLPAPSTQYCVAAGTASGSIASSDRALLVWMIRICPDLLDLPSWFWVTSGGNFCGSR